jgi:hypothetical protein
MAHNHYWSWLQNGCFSLNIQFRKNDISLFFLRYIKILPNMQKKGNFSADSLDCGPILDNLEITQ